MNREELKLKVEEITQQIESLKDCMDSMADQIKMERDKSVHKQYCLIKTMRATNLSRTNLEDKINTLNHNFEINELRNKK